MTFVRRLLAWGLLEIIGGLVFILPATELSAQSRIAVLGDLGQHRAEVDTLVERLSKDSGVEMVERSEIDRIIAEQNISRFSADDAVKIGKLLGADGVIVIKSFRWEKSNVLSARLVSTDSGAVVGFWIQDTPSREAFRFADAVKFEFTPLFSKLKLKRGDVTALSLLDVRATFASPHLLHLEKNVTLLLSHRLMLEKDFVVLERWRLSNIAWEKELSLDQGEFWTGSYVLDGNVESLNDGSGTIKAVLRLRKAGEEKPELIEVEGSSLDVKAFVEKMVPLINEKINRKSPDNASPAVWDIQKEAEFYFKESQWLLASGNYERAREAADAAATLGKKGPEINFIRVKSYLGEIDTNFIKHWRYRRTKFKDAAEERQMRNWRTSMSEYSFDRLIQALDIYIKFVEGGPQSLPGSFYHERDWRFLGNELARISVTLLNKFIDESAQNKSMDTNTVLKERVKLVRSLLRKAVYLTFDKGDDSRGINNLYFTYLCDLNLFSDAPSELAEEYTRLLSKKFTCQTSHYTMVLAIRKKIQRPELQILDMNAKSVCLGLRKLDSREFFSSMAEKLRNSDDPRSRIDALALAGNDADPERISEALWAYRDQIISGAGYYGDTPGILLETKNCPREILARLLLYAFSGDSIWADYVIDRLLNALAYKDEKSESAEEDNRNIVKAWYDYNSRVTRIWNRGDMAFIDLIKEKIGKLSPYRPENASNEGIPVLTPSLSCSIRDLFNVSHSGFVIENVDMKNNFLQVGGYFMCDENNIKRPKAYLAYCSDKNSSPCFVAAPEVSWHSTPMSYPFNDNTQDLSFSGFYAGLMLAAGNNVFHASNDGKVNIMENGLWRELKNTGFVNATAMAFADDMLFVAYGRISNRYTSTNDPVVDTSTSSIVRLNVKNGDMTILASSRRNPPLSPLDNCSPWYVRNLICSENSILAANVITDTKTYNQEDGSFYTNVYSLNMGDNKWKNNFKSTGGYYTSPRYSGNILRKDIFNCMVFNSGDGAIRNISSRPFGDFTRNESADLVYSNYRFYMVTTDNGKKLLRLTQLDENLFELKAVDMNDNKLSVGTFKLKNLQTSQEYKHLCGFAASEKSGYMALGTAKRLFQTDALLASIDLDSVLAAPPAGGLKTEAPALSLKTFDAVSKVPSNMKPGLKMDFFKGDWSYALPPTHLMTPASSRVEASMKTPVMDWSEHAVFSFKGYFHAEKEGRYTFMINGRSAGVLYIDGKPDDYISKTWMNTPYTVADAILKPGYHSVRFDVWIASKKNLEVTVKKPGEDKYTTTEGLVFYEAPKD